MLCESQNFQTKDTLDSLRFFFQKYNHVGMKHKKILFQFISKYTIEYVIFFDLILFSCVIKKQKFPVSISVLKNNISDKIPYMLFLHCIYLLGFLYLVVFIQINIFKTSYDSDISYLIDSLFIQYENFSLANRSYKKSIFQKV